MVNPRNPVHMTMVAMWLAAMVGIAVLDQRTRPEAVVEEPSRVRVERVYIVAKNGDVPSAEVSIGDLPKWYKLAGAHGPNRVARTNAHTMWQLDVPVGVESVLVSFAPETHKETWIGLDTGERDE